jgi:hypothetical protein
MVELDPDTAAAIVALQRDIHALRWGDAVEYAREFASMQGWSRLARMEDGLGLDSLYEEIQRAQKLGPQLCEALRELRDRAAGLDADLAVDLEVVRCRFHDLGEPFARHGDPVKIARRGLAYSVLNERATALSLVLGEICDDARIMVGDPRKPFWVWRSTRGRLTDSWDPAEFTPPEVDRRALRIMERAVARLPEQDRARYRRRYLGTLHDAAVHSKRSRQQRRQARQMSADVRVLGKHLKRVRCEGWG